MATACERLDELVKEYLLYRGFSATVKVLDHELKHDKDKGLRADKIVDQLLAYINASDLSHFREYWSYLRENFLSRLDQRYSVSVRKLEVSLLKLYLVTAHVYGRKDHIREVFEKLSLDLQNQQEFKEWFAFPFLASPAENNSFGLYFTRQWQETLTLSLHNFLQVVLQAMPVPTLLNFDHDFRHMRTLQEENEFLKQQLHHGGQADRKAVERKLAKPSILTASQAVPELIYDFSGLAKESETVIAKQKPSRRFPITLSAPLMRRNKNEMSDTTPGPADSQKLQQKQKAVPMQPDSKFFNQSSNSSSSGPTPRDSRLAHQVSGSSSSGTAGIADKPGSPLLVPSGTSATKQMGAGAGCTTSASKGLSQQKVESSTSIELPQMAEIVRQMSSTQPEAAAGGQSKGARELTSFPPYNSPQSEMDASQTLCDTSPRLDQGKQDQSAKASSAVETAVAAEESAEPWAVESNEDLQGLDTIQLQLLGEKPDVSCPFLRLNEDVYIEHQSAIRCGRFSRTGQHVASLDLDGIVKVWTWSPQPSTTATVMSRSPFLSLDWASKSDRWLLLGNNSGCIRLFDTRELKTCREVTVEPMFLSVHYLSTCPASMRFAASLVVTDTTMGRRTESGRLAVWDLKTLKNIQNVTVEPEQVATNCCVYSVSGQSLLLGGFDGIVRLFDTSQGRCISSWKAHRGPVQTLHFGHRESTFFSMGLDSKLSEWSLNNTKEPLRQILVGREENSAGATKRQMSSGAGPVSQVFSLNKNKSYLLTFLKNRGIVCKVPDGKSDIFGLMDLSSHGELVTTVDWSQCAETDVCLTGCQDGQIKICTLLYH